MDFQYVFSKTQYFQIGGDIFSVWISLETRTWALYISSGSNDEDEIIDNCNVYRQNGAHGPGVIPGGAVTCLRNFRTDFLEEWPTPGTGPHFDTSMPSNFTGLVGSTVHLVCKVKNLGNRTVSNIGMGMGRQCRIPKRTSQLQSHEYQANGVVSKQIRLEPGLFPTNSVVLFLFQLVYSKLSKSSQKPCVGCLLFM